MYFKLDYNFKQAIIYLIQLTILISNNTKNSVKYEKIESSVSSIDVFYFIEILPIFEFDFDECFKIAVDNFKLDEYLNNLDKVHDELQEILKKR